jgi:hypothetical protein
MKKNILFIILLFIACCDDGKEAKFQKTFSIFISNKEYKYSLRSVSNYGPTDATIYGRSEIIFVKDIKRLNFNDITEKTQFISFIQYYLDHIDLIPENNILHKINIQDRYFVQDRVMSEPYYLGIQINRDSIVKRYLVGDIIFKYNKR